MQKKLYCKTFAVGIIVLFIGVGIHPVFAVNLNKEYIQDENHTKDMKYDNYNNLIKQITKSKVISDNIIQGQDKPFVSKKATKDIFGCSVSINGNYAIIGARDADDNGEDSGSAYIFKRSGNRWSLQQKLLASDGAKGDCFGMSVSINGNSAIIGACLDDDKGFNSGSAYIFACSGTYWFEQQKLLASDGLNNDWFGYSVSIDGNYAIIGAPFNNDKGVESGSAYIFKRDGTTWSEQQKLLASDGKHKDYFGISVSIDGNYAIIGAPCDIYYGFSSGSAYIFKRDGTIWSEQVKLTPSEGTEEDFIGYSVSIDGNYAIIGAPFDNDNGYWSGSAYIFKRDGTTWSEQQKLLASDGATYDLFGLSVSIDGDYAVIGAPFNYSGGGGDSGSVYFFKRDGTTWSKQAKLIPLDIADGDCFGYSVSIDGDYAIIGVPYDDDNGPNSGSAFIFKRLGIIWLKQDKLILSTRASHYSFSLRFFDMFPILQRIIGFIL